MSPVYASGRGGQPLSKDDYRTSVCLLQVLDTFVEGQPLNALYLKTFVLAGMNEGSSVQELAGLAEVGSTVMTRHLQALSEVDRRREEGLGLVVVKQDPNNLRRHVVGLTPKGRARYRKLLELVRAGE